MIDTAELADAFDRNVRIIESQTAGLTHLDSLLQPAVRGNCLNWVLGHIVVNRNRALRALGVAPAIADALVARYARDSEPVTADRDGVLALETLLEALRHSQESIAAALRRTTAADLAKKLDTAPHITTVGQVLFGLYFHETYHTGQTELLRQLAGKNDRVI
jgi:hypothetical protein